MKTNLFKVFFLKEKKFWERNWNIRKKLTWVGFVICVLLLIVPHYAFMLMHFLFESALWIFKRTQFRENIKLLQNSIKV
jgi:hypothetical protein